MATWRVWPLVKIVCATWIASTARETTVTSFGNPLRPWPTVANDRDVVVLDLGLCVGGGSGGHIHIVHAYGHDNGAGDWPLFLVVRHSVDLEWIVQAATEVSWDVGRMPVQMHLRDSLLVQAGDCIAWWSGSKPRIDFSFISNLDDALSAEQHFRTFSASTAALAAPSQGAHLRFNLKIQYRRHAVRATLVPSPHSFLANAMHMVAGGHERLAPSSISKAEAQRDCWTHGLPPENCCVPAGRGLHTCFDARFTFEACCDVDVVGSNIAFKPLHSKLKRNLKAGYVDKASGAPRSVPNVSVDLFVRTFHAKFEELLYLIRSVALFWPPSWGVVVVLDGGTVEDEASCKVLPTWVRCVIEAEPPFQNSLNLSFPSLALSKYRGMVWKEWSECWADRHSNADYIAISDSDVVFSTFGIPQLIFADSINSNASSQLRPIIWAHAETVQFPEAIAALGLAWQAEFMDAFPLMVKRSHFAALRDFVTSRFVDVNNPVVGKDAKFNQAFEVYVRLVHDQAASIRGRGECPSFHSMMGSYLWHHHREEYVWSIRHGHVTGVPLEHTCPRLRVAQHVAYWGRESWMHHIGYPYKHVKMGGRPTHLAEVAYGARATALILAGLCDVTWAHCIKSDSVQCSSPRPLFAMVRNRTDMWTLPDLGLQDLNRDLCTHAISLAEDKSASDMRLLSRAFPGQLWTVEESAHCGNLQVPKLLEEYRKLLSGFVFAV